MNVFYKSLLVLLLLFFTSKVFSSYNYNDSTTVIHSNKNDSIPHKKSTKKEKRLLNSARKELAKENYEEAKVDYLKLIELNPINDIYNYETGLSFFLSTFERTKSIPYFKNALLYSIHDTIPEIKYYLGRAYHINGEFEKSNKMLSEFESEINIHYQGQYLVKEIQYRITLNNNGINYLNEKDTNIIIKNLGEKVNTIYREYAPIFKNDDQIIIFTSRRKGTKGSKLAPDRLPYEDIYVAIENAQKSWTLVSDENEITKYLPSDYNTDKHKAGVVYSIDGKTLYLYKEDKLWTSVHENGKWGSLEKLEDDVNDSKLNIPSATISPDGNTVYFVTTQKDGFGGSDLYKITKDSITSKWNKSENLGPEINTKFNEDAPFISSDGKVLYFASKGHDGMGGFDIYKCYITNGILSKPINLGIPMNSPANDIYLVIDNKNKSGFFSSDREGGYGEMDLYSFSVRSSNIKHKKLNDSTISDTVNIDVVDTSSSTPITIAQNSYQENLIYNAINIDNKNLKYVALVDYAIAQMKITGKKIIISIESSASHLPTKIYKNNSKLASIRGENAKNTFIQSLLDKGVKEEMIEVNTIKTFVSGPKYDKDYSNKRKYLVYQYIKITID